MIRINNVHLPLDYNDETIKNKTAKELRIDKNSIKNISIFRRSIDARKKDNIYFLCTVDVNLSVNEDSVIRKFLDQSKEVNCSKAIICTSSGFTSSATGFAENRPIELIGKEKLENILSKAGI